MIDPRTVLNGKMVLVTGGAGFIGSHLCDHLMGYGASVVCFDNLSTGSRQYVDSQKGNAKFSFVLGDANVVADLEKVFRARPVDYIFHYAAVVGVKRTNEKPLEVLNDLEGFKHIAALAYAHSAKKIVFSSSSEIYGQQKEVPFHEDMSYHDTRHPYALVKATGESYFKSFSEVSGVPVVSLRFFNVYGPRQESSAYGFVTGIFISQVLMGMPPTIFRDGSQTRDFTYVDDNVEAAIQALVNPATDGEVVNVGTGIETSIAELARKIIATSGHRLEPVFLRTHNLAESPRRVAHTGKLTKLTGFECRMALDDGLKKTYDWYNAHKDRLLSKDKLSFEEYERGVWRPREKEA
ncbi:MAG: hypothetical protein A3I44_03580 [Candidatus Sungbacteria bacterium RIFCSPLOWO2_02_FULL_51_17]|uniref:NAD-dependent epimerase/dehydratase domain-containing protein n=1 Tax=Candidatus Sungbacteria bacterium RIFCSPHIGHO2_02_FULL_51_29 TaxID=1802273 RepID=A0A1G2KRZ2_9BACT|nr:MAG: hypothetical protein A2676_03360 [Candidatus Sungbacteria bacterium RIFCSPHIGHO2_01_FULL_51_22]OHA02113.1 MAG: hypothetical protein A3C16_04860 [Candidatus Sungbacteria bacterium RIFCSPHIGHO2_02_FULL_51_29]OHA07121.1 MAG: hypothetical protein A3B29_02635 [Candidatus Sungbacteria bacterium RIFCSPLOWO2_01_FULL_51_34]OHA10469.1 MAG: hypothetical protein A3I44_03580 [Candidatus Sungbacteria bacterium RIFCSPLOWO2_02_FULL_51_17]